MDYSDINGLPIEWDGNKVHIGPREAVVTDFVTEYLKPKLGAALKEYLGTPEGLQREEFIEALENVFKKYKEEPQKHIKIDVTATPKQIESYQYTITLTALDEYGVDLIKDMVINK